MNEKIKEVYERMFSPAPIPDCIEPVCDRVIYLLNRVDAPPVTIRDLAIIAVMSLGKNGDLVSTIPAQEERTFDPNAAIPIAEDTTKKAEPAPEEPDETSEEFDTGPNIPAKTGIMDAQVRTNKRVRGLSLAKLNQLSMTELRAHAEEFYGCKIPKQFNKGQAAAFLHGQTPIK